MVMWSISRINLPFFYYVHHGGTVLLVNVDRVKRKLHSLLVDGDTTKRKYNNDFMRNRYRLIQFQKLVSPIESRQGATNKALSKERALIRS